MDGNSITPTGAGERELSGRIVPGGDDPLVTRRRRVARTDRHSIGCGVTIRW
jgi:hypothetical protein